MRIEEVWFSRAPAAAVSRAILAPASWLYALGWQTYAAMYRFGLKKAKEPHKPVLCIGNLVVGGSGKTPATLAVAKTLAAMGESTVLSVSGYGSPRAEAASVAPDGPLNAADWGDEPAMIRWLMPGLPLIVGRRRVLAAELATQHFPGHVLLMDDGFQHLPLRKHVKMLLDPEPVVNSHCLPAGPYREPRGNRRKADLVFGARFDLVRHPVTFRDSLGGDASPPPQAAMLCAIGRPDSFHQSLTEARVTVTQEVRRPDHDPLTAGNLLDGLDRNTALVVTAKDWVKLQARSDLEGRSIFIALQNADIEPAAQFQVWLGDRLSKARGS